jgi:hypothetical protein
MNNFTQTNVNKAFDQMFVNKIINLQGWINSYKFMGVQVEVHSREYLESLDPQSLQDLCRKLNKLYEELGK